MKNKTSFFDRISCAIADQYIATRSTLTLINPSLFMWSNRPYFYEIVINLDFWLKSHSFYPVIHWKLNLKGILSKKIIIVWRTRFQINIIVQLHNDKNADANHAISLIFIRVKILASIWEMKLVWYIMFVYKVEKWKVSFFANVDDI